MSDKATVLIVDDDPDIRVIFRQGAYPDDVRRSRLLCQRLRASGRGGGGFPTRRKWSLAAAQKSDEKYVVCNADEGDPGASWPTSICIPIIRNGRTHSYGTTLLCEPRR